MKDEDMAQDHPRIFHQIILSRLGAWESRRHGDREQIGVTSELAPENWTGG